MQYKSIIKKFFLWSMIPLMLIFVFTIIIDPYDVTSINLLNIKYKLTRDGRQQKINQIKRIQKIDNLILGSSRSERLNPKTVDSILGGFTYTFGIGGANIEDALGLLLYLEKTNKMPKDVILCIDFAGFRKDLNTPDGFYKIPELNFLGKSTLANTNYSSKLFSLDAFRSAIKTFQNHISGKKPNSYIADNGFLVNDQEPPSGDMKEIKKLADEYYSMGYKYGNMEFSQARFEYLKQIVVLSKKHNFKLYVMLTPVQEYLYVMIEKNSKLYNKLSFFKKELAKITPYYDAMILVELTKNKENFGDAVHTNVVGGDMLLKELLMK